MLNLCDDITSPSHTPMQCLIRRIFSLNVQRTNMGIDDFFLSFEDILAVTQNFFFLYICVYMLLLQKYHQSLEAMRMRKE